MLSCIIFDAFIKKDIIIDVDTKKDGIYNLC